MMSVVSCQAHNSTHFQCLCFLGETMLNECCEQQATGNNLDVSFRSVLGCLSMSFSKADQSGYASV